MHPSSVYAAIKNVLATTTNRPVSKITKDKTLSGRWPKGFNFTSAGLAGLVQSLNERFDQLGHRIEPILHPGEVSLEMSVGVLFELIRPRV